MKLSMTTNRFLLALASSLLLHSILLAIHFTTPAGFKLKSVDPALEVILVNAKHNKQPIHADAVAQANLDGGGDRDVGRAKSPLPDMHTVKDGNNIAERRVAALEAQQRKMLAQVNQTSLVVSAHTSKELPHTSSQQRDTQNSLEATQAIARMEAEIARNLEAYNKRPKKVQITARTKQVNYALYYKALQEKIERIGTLHFPQHNGQKLYGELVISIPIFQDGSIYETDGGVHIEASSGNPILDQAALNIVRHAAPFGRFPDHMRSASKNEVWEVITRFRFTHEARLQTSVSRAD